MAERYGFFKCCICLDRPACWEGPHLSRVLIRRNKKRHSRIMLPMSIRCSTCGDYISEGTEFHSRMEQVVGETSLGINVFGFYFKCPKCSVELTIKTYPHDPKCVVESGATTVAENEKSEAEEMGDVMNSSQQRTCTLSDLDETKLIEKSKDFFHRIEDEQFEAKDYLTRPCASNDISLNNALKKRKFS